MPYREKKVDKLFYQIGEVAEMFSEPVSTIRFWEKEFDVLKPKKNNKGNRLFLEEDIKEPEADTPSAEGKGHDHRGCQKISEEQP